MARQIEAGQYQRLKEYPNVPGRVLKTAGTVVAALAAAHFAPLAVHGIGFDQVTLLGGAAQGVANFADMVATGVGNGVNSVVEHIPGAAKYVQAAPEFLLHNGISENLLSHVSNASKIVTRNDLVTAEAGAALSAVLGLGHLATTAAKRPEIVPAPNDVELTKAREVIAKLQSKRFRKRKYAKLNEDEVAVEISGMSNELKKGKIDRSAVWAQAAGPSVSKLIAKTPFVRKILTPEWAARTTLKKETYRRLPGNFVHGIWSVTDGTTAEWIKKIPGAGDTFNFFSDVGDYVVGGIMPKRDVFGKWHFGVENILTDGVATALGDFASAVPFLTSNDIKETIEIMARPALATGLNGEVDKAAAAIVGSRVARKPRRYSQGPKRA